MTVEIEATPLVEHDFNLIVADFLGTATAGADYQDISESLEFKPGRIRCSFRVELIDDERD